MDAISFWLLMAVIGLAGWCLSMEMTLSLLRTRIRLLEAGKVFE